MMATSHVELYEALKPTVGEKAAKLMADVVPAAENLATKEDLLSSEARLSAQVNANQADLLRLEVHVAEGFTSQLRWMIGLFVPVWLGTWGTVVAVLLKG